MISNGISNGLTKYSLKQFCHDLANGNYAVLSIDLEKNGSRIAALQQEMHKSNNKSPMPHKAIEKLVEDQSFKFKGKSWSRFNIMVISFLQFCRDINPWSIWDSCDLIFQMYQDFNNCLINDSYPLDPLVPVFQEMTEYVIPIASTLDSNYLSIGTKKYQFLSFSSSVISKLFNSIKSSRVNDEYASQSGSIPEFPEKQKILLYLVNKLNNIYFQIDSPQLCFNVFKNFKPKSMITRFSDYPIKEQIEYRYLLGRYYLLNDRVTNAFSQLNNAYTLLTRLCEKANLFGFPQVRRNLVRILRYLIPTGLIMGKLPKFDMIRMLDPSLAQDYYIVAKNLRAGNIREMNTWLKTHEREMCERHLLLVLIEKLPMICYRNLIRTIIKECIIPQNTGKLPYTLVGTALRISIGDCDGSLNSSINIYTGIHRAKNVENVLVTLINLGFLRGNCFPQLRICVIKKTAVVADILPSIQDRIVNSFTLNEDDSWLDD